MFPSSFQLPRVLAIIGPYFRAREIIDGLAQYEPIGVIDLDAPLHEALTDLKFGFGQGEDEDWNHERHIREVNSLRNWVETEYGPSFLWERATETIDLSEESHTLYVVPNVRFHHEFVGLKKHFRHELMTIHIRDGAWQPMFSDGWAIDDLLIHKLEVGDVPLISQLIELLNPDDSVIEREAK